MGFGNGIGIGWPMASSSRGANLGYFNFAERCGEILPRDRTTQLVDTSIYHTGDYVDGVDGLGNTFRWLLGEIVPTPGDHIIEISGPTYISCPAPLYFGFREYCNGSEVNQTYYGPAVQIWQVGQVVRNAEFPSVDNYVIINSIVPDLGGEYQMTTLIGPALNGCPIP